MTQDGRGQPVVVPVGSCGCPRAPHATDTVTLRGEPSVPMGVAAWAVVRAGGDAPTITGRLAEVWLRFGIVEWTFTNEAGRPEPITPENIERLLPFGRGLELADRADGLYADEVLRPLVERQSRLLPPTPTDDSTSANPESGDMLPTPSSPSPRTARAGKRSEVPAR